MKQICMRAFTLPCICFLRHKKAIDHLAIVNVHATFGTGMLRQLPCSEYVFIYLFMPIFAVLLHRMNIVTLLWCGKEKINASDNLCLLKHVCTLVWIHTPNGLYVMEIAHCMLMPSQNLIMTFKDATNKQILSIVYL